jgi:hypothetical protein
MRVLSQTELSRLSRAELMALSMATLAMMPVEPVKASNISIVRRRLAVES